MMVNLRDVVVNHANIRMLIVVNYLKLDADFSSYATEKAVNFAGFYRAYTVHAPKTLCGWFFLSRPRRTAREMRSGPLGSLKTTLELLV